MIFERFFKLYVFFAYATVLLSPFLILSVLKEGINAVTGLVLLLLLFTLTIALFFLFFFTGDKNWDIGFSEREGAFEKWKKLQKGGATRDLPHKPGKRHQTPEYHCENCGLKVSKRTYEQNDGLCDTCVAEDTHVAMFDANGEPY